MTEAARLTASAPPPGGRPETGLPRETRLPRKAADTAAPPSFPTVLKINGRGYVWQSQWEAYKDALAIYAIGGQPGPPPLSRPKGDSLLPIKVTCQELGLNRRSIGRRMKAAADAAARRLEKAKSEAKRPEDADAAA